MRMRCSLPEDHQLGDHVELPDIYLGFLVINGLKLDEQEIKAMLNYTRGDIKPSSIKSWLRKNEAKLTINHLGTDRKQPGSSAILYTDEIHDDDEAYDEEDTAMENFYAELTDSVQGGDAESDALSEGEAAEILHTLIKSKNRTFTQSLKAKKAVELSRGYGGKQFGESKGFGKGSYKGRGKHYHLTVDGIRSLVKCYNCDEKGHIVKHCPKPKRDRGQGSADKEVHFLNYEHDNAEAFFCGMLETASSPTEMLETTSSPTEKMLETTSSPTEKTSRPTEPTDVFQILSPDHVVKTETSFDLGPQQAIDLLDRVRKPESDYMMRSRDLFFFENFICNSVFRRPDIPDTACATIDTGCQRAAVGLQTLKQLQQHIPEPLKIVTRDVTNRFKSVRGMSETKRGAFVPCGIGPKGCFLNPTIFEECFGTTAPLLLSLPFLLQSRCKLILDAQHGLGIQMEDPHFYIPCHLGPSGSLRIPLTRYTRRMMYHLNRVQRPTDVQEFEVLTLQTDGHLSDHVSEPCHSPSVSDTTPEARHGAIHDQQEGQGHPPLCPTVSMAPVDAQDAVAHSATDTNFGTPDQDQPCGGRDGTLSEQQLVPSRIDSTETPSRSNGGFPIAGDAIRLPEGPDCWSSRATSATRRISVLRLQTADQAVDCLHGGSQSQQDLSPVPQGDRKAMPILSEEPTSATDRPSHLALHGGREGQRQEQLRDPTSAGARDLHTPPGHQSWIEWIRKTCKTCHKILEITKI